MKKIPNDDTAVDIKGIVFWYRNLGEYGVPANIREYASQKLDFSVKISEMI